ncbi:LysE/ArgO family amino acid transporter [Limnochorda pilosa]|uniref:Lysine transporter LysE n=1 Tax=Limnochorda pilosa TaxID=1555112 RepID=A0A0K2SHB0_LIMPI|nr:LysE family transporter [Limnochorda pilosa]BAS26480.1 hypothetical protein LIP_0623 [Limnochorda pilosa]
MTPVGSLVTAYVSGLALGLTMILPIGPQNLFVLTQGLRAGLRGALLAVVTTGLCDTVLIVSGAAGLSAVLNGLPWLRGVLLAVGVLFLFHLGVATLREPLPVDGRLQGPAPGEGAAARDEPAGRGTPGPLPTGAVVARAIGVSWGNPHAILDTVAILGGLIASQPVASRLPFAAGAVSASWLFFLTLAAAGSIFRARMTPRWMRVTQWISGAVMILFGLGFAVEALRELM